MIQDAWGWCTGMTQRDGMGKEVGGGSGLGTQVHSWWIQVNVLAKPILYIYKEVNRVQILNPMSCLESIQ